MPVEFENGHVVGFTEASRTLGDNVEHWLELGRRGTDNPQNLSHRRLLLERLGKFLFQIGAGFADAANAHSCLRSGRTKLAAACWALCAFERQGHLVGTVTGPVRSAQPSNPNRTAR